MRAVVVIGAALLAAGVFNACTAKPESLRTGAMTTRPATRLARSVQGVEAKPSAASEDLLIPAALSVEVTSLVLAQRDGLIRELAAPEGSRVIKGNVIAKLSGDDDLRAQLKQAELEVSRLELEQREYDALVKLNRNELERENLLFKQGLTPQRDVERAQFKL